MSVPCTLAWSSMSQSSSSSEAAVQQCVDTYNQRLDDIGTVNP